MVFLALLGLAALDAAGYSMIAPVVPAIARTTSSGPALMGALVTSFAVGQLVGYPVAGRWIRRRHAAFVLAAALVLMAIGDLGFILSNSLPVYFASRFVQGIGAGGLWLGVTFGMLERYPDNPYPRLSAVLAAYSVGGIAGPALGGVGGIHGPFAAHLVLVGAGAAAVFVIGAPQLPATFGSDRTALREPGFLLASAGILLVSLSLGTLEGPLALHFGERLSQGSISGLFVGISLLVGISAAGAGRGSGPRSALVVGASLLTLAVPLAAATSTVAVWIVAAALFGLGFGIAETGALGVLLDTVGTTRIVLAMVVWSQLWAVGYLVGPAVGGGLAQGLGAPAIGLVSAVGALLMLAAFIASARRPVPSPASEVERASS